MSEQRGRLLLVNQTKFFAPSGRAGCNAKGPNEQKFLCRFFQKAAAFLFPAKPVTF
jgi:hypothetical protein